MSDHPEARSEVRLSGAQARELTDLLMFLGEWLSSSEDNEQLAVSLARFPDSAGDQTLVQVQVALSRFATLLDPSDEMDF